MGTRNLICVFYNGDYRVAQYGQWDGYPEGQGKRVLEFLQSTNLDEFKEKLKFIRFSTQEDKKGLNEFMKSIGCEDGWMTIDQADKFKRTYPLLTRDNGAKILSMIMDLESHAFIENSISFAGDSLFCEWAYVIDLDKEVLEIYKGFNKHKVLNGRFVSGDPDLEKTDGYEPVVMIKTYYLNKLPSLEKFYNDLIEKDENE